MGKIIRGVFKEEKIPIIVSTKNKIEVPQKRSAKADPIVERNIIADVSENFVSRGKYRDNLLFILGCNCGLRGGEIISLKWGQLINDDGSLKEQIIFIEEKNSKKNKTTGELIKGQIKTRVVDVGETVHDALRLHMSQYDCIDLGDYVFKSEARSKAYYTEKRKAGSGAKDDHITLRAVDKILKKTVNDILGHEDIHASTHLMRKTFARYVYDNAPDKRHALKFLQKVLGHASADSTLHYIGITEKEVRDVVVNLDLGKRTTDLDTKKINGAQKFE